MPGESAYTRANYGFEDIALKGTPVAACASCHGKDGGGGGVFPNLTLQDETYLRDTLYAFAAGTRRSAYMQIMASQLSPQQINALAKYYASQPRRRADANPPAPTALGEAVALRGESAKGIGACASCHGATARTGKAYPRLEGQSAWYIANQMRLFAGDGRGSTARGDNPMTAIARGLTPAQIDAVAAWYAAQPPVPVQARPAVQVRQAAR
ncbi:c-type cytochrome [Sphingomonas sp. ASV193]|uniref:c-type cytochrome n=1 Tax=Sphingomonas sp. ASV193 TaxID=3144405 RepID=UPI0032E87154